jgi:hypothetical protein
MGNHYHLEIKTGSIPLWRSMLRLQAGIARGFNKRRRYLGRLWQSQNRVRIIEGRIEFTTFAISRYEYRVCDVAELIQKHRRSITLWLNKGLLAENTNPEFARRLDQLDEQI